ncbi:MAG: ASPIC/UnbV domain-containing protein, partial [Planctomycetota bacterium]
GARVELTLDGITQVREVRSGSTYVSENALDLHFGLGAAAEIGSIEVAWPGGGRTVVRDAAADRLITITQP